MDLDDWKTVTRSDKKRVMRSRGRKHKTRISVTVNHSALAVMEDLNLLEQVLDQCMRDLEQTQLHQDLLRQLQDLDFEPCRLVCYGIGNFSNTSAVHYSAAMWQMASAFCLRRMLHDGNSALEGASSISFYDPCTSPMEERLLIRRGVQLLSSNEKGKMQFSDDVPLLFFMPHCPKRLYENVTFAHWTVLARIGIVGNSLISHAEALSDNSNSCPCLKALIPIIRERKLQAAVEDFERAEGNFLGAFNDTFLSTFEKESTDCEWPGRPSFNTDDDDENGELI